MIYNKNLKKNINIRVSVKDYKMLKSVCSFYNTSASEFLREHISHDYYLLSDVWGFIGFDEDIEDVNE